MSAPLQISSIGLQFTDTGNTGVGLVADNSSVALIIDNDRIEQPLTSSRLKANFNGILSGGQFHSQSGITRKLGPGTPENYIGVAPRGSSVSSWFRCVNSGSNGITWRALQLYTQGGGPTPIKDVRTQKGVGVGIRDLEFSSYATPLNLLRMGAGGGFMCGAPNTNMFSISGAVLSAASSPTAGQGGAMSFNMLDLQNTMVPGTFYNIIEFGSTNQGLLGAVRMSTTQVQVAFLSDYRRKANVRDLDQGLEQARRLRPCRFHWRNDPDGPESWGFLAHEVQEVYPRAVSGEKDAQDSRGQVRAQMMDASLLVPMLTAAVKQLRAATESARARIENLKGQV